MKLRDAMPKEAVLGCEFEDQKYNDYLDVEVLETITEYDQRFPFKHKNIHVWWILENGMAVAWNENPSVGWSFPTARTKIIHTKCPKCGYYSLQKGSISSKDDIWCIRWACKYKEESK